MWLMTTRGFYSAVQHYDDAEKMMVRARCEDDIRALEDLLPAGTEPVHTPDADYQWRVVVSRDDWMKAVARLVTEVDYPNFKNAVPCKVHATAYGDVWGTMYMALDSRARDDRSYWRSAR